MKFEEIFNNLIISLEKNDKVGIKNSIKYNIKYINNILGTNFKTNYIDLNDIRNLEERAFMYALPTDNSINYNADLILDTKNKIIKKGKEIHIDKYYNDVTYAMYIIQCIAHELWHCKQFVDNKNGNPNKQTYLNSLCSAIDYDKKINYSDKSFEGDAYGIGVSIMKELCNEKTIKNKDYLKQFKNQRSMNVLNFYTANIISNEVINHLDQIPFFKRETDQRFCDIYINSSYYIAKQINHKKRENIINNFPLITIGIEEENNNGRLKTPLELMYQYFNHCILYNGKKSEITKKASFSFEDTLEEAYIYLLIPQLTHENYNHLCTIYGHDKMDKFMKKLIKRIDDNLSIYELNYNWCKGRLKIIREEKKGNLGIINEDYAAKKYETARYYLNDYKNRIKNLIDSKNKIK